MIEIENRLAIPDAELQFTFARSSGPGGQNVNKVNSKATLRWNVALSPSLPDPVRNRFMAKYRHRITQAGELVVMSQRYRDQPKNVADCCEKVEAMLREVLDPPKRRHATKPTRGSKVRRLENKRQQSDKKQSRRNRKFGE